jgi:alkylhydroperoxidase family enzyme
MNTFEVPGDADIDMPVEPSRAELVAPAIEAAGYYGGVRAAPLLPRDASEEERGAANEAIERWGEGERAVLDVLSHVPLVARNTAVAREWIRGRLTPRNVTELASLTAARVNASPYLWSEHEARALEAGVSPAGVAMAMGMTGGAVPLEEAELVEFTRMLLRRNRVPEPLFDRMLERLELEGLVELTAVVGFTSMLACLANAFEVQR